MGAILPVPMEYATGAPRVAVAAAPGGVEPGAVGATAFRASGEISTFEKAFYFSAQNYTTLGYGDIVLSDRWRLLGPLEAINGLLLFGLSTAAMFAALSRLVSGHLNS